MNRHSLGEPIALWRLGRGWSRAYLAKRLGVVTGTVGKWERGENRPPRWHLAALCRLGFVTPPRQQPCVMSRPPVVRPEQEHRGGCSS